MIEIRRATENDLDALLRLNAVVQSWHAAAYPDRFKADVDATEMRAFFARMLAEEDCLIWITAEECGYLFARHRPGKETPYGMSQPDLHVEHIAVLPERQCEGIGRALLDTAETQARSLGCTTLTLNTWAANHDAHRMFEAAGMAPLRHHYSKVLG